MCVSNRIEQFSASYFLTGHLLFTVLLAQVAHEQGVGDDGSRDGDDHSDNTAHHIGHADVVQDCGRHDGDHPRRAQKGTSSDSVVTHSSHLLPKGELKAKGDFFALLVTLSEKLI